VCPKVGAIAGMLPKQGETEICFGCNHSNIHVGELTHCHLPDSGLKSSEKRDFMRFKQKKTVLRLLIA